RARMRVRSDGGVVLHDVDPAFGRERHVVALGMRRSIERHGAPERLAFRRAPVARRLRVADALLRRQLQQEVLLFPWPARGARTDALNLFAGECRALRIERPGERLATRSALGV